MKKIFKSCYLAFVLLILYTPILVLIIFSFNSIASSRNFAGFSLINYQTLFAEKTIWESLSVTLIVAVISTIIAVIIGTFAALGLSKMNNITKNITLGISNVPLVNADIVTAVALMLLFTSLLFNFGLFTLILAHISFNIPYVIITILPKLRAIAPSQLEASQDLGASSWYTLRKIVIPTIKPAILTAAAIAFAMSFDDFIISYFTGGSAVNLSSYIYSLKQTKPYINAFSTLIIIIIALFVICGNGWQIIVKQIRVRNELIMNQTYRDKKIIKLEKNLLKHYLQINKIFRKPMPNNKANIISFIDENDWIIKKSLEPKTKKILNKITSVEAKIAAEYQWLEHIKANILTKKQEKEERSRILRDKYQFLKWPWKVIAASSLITSSFIVALVFYHKTTNYDLTIAIWGEYINDSFIQKFEQKYQVKVKYATYDDNESLQAKLRTTNYDIIVPSDYMVATLAKEAQIIKLDPNKLTKNWKNTINPTLRKQMENYQVTTNNGNKASLLDYSVPYYWGDMILIFNKKTPNLLKKLEITSFDNTSWDILKVAAAKQLKIVLNEDMYNIFMLGLVSLHYENKWHKNDNNHEFNDYVNAHDEQEIIETAKWLKPIIQNPNTSLKGDEINDVLVDSDQWDIAVAYNGDLVGALQQFKGDNKHKHENYAFVRPYTGTNYWNDNMAITKKSQNKALAYNFINFIMETNIQVALSQQFNYTSPFQAALTQVQANSDSLLLKAVYEPGNGQALSKNKPKGFYNGLYVRKFATKMQNEFNKLVTAQSIGDNYQTKLMLQILIAVIIIIVFIFMVTLIK